MNRKAGLILIALAVIAVAGLLVQVYFHVFGAESLSGDGGDPNEGIIENHDCEDGHGEGALEMSAAQRQANGIVISLVERRALADEISVPGEVRLDLYRTSRITPRIPAQVVTRHARLGEIVKAGQPLITLSSVEMAEAQGGLIVANREWQRVSGLGRDVVSGRRYVEAQVAAQQAKARVEAFGMTLAQTDALLQKSDASEAIGAFTLLAPQDGTIVGDDFVVGEFVEPGRTLVAVSDETRVWVEAQLGAEQAVHIEIGTPARILVGGRHVISGSVIQVHHTLDEATRTLPVRIEVENTMDELHPGQFVNVSIRTGETEPVLAVPENAVVLLEGRSTVFRVEDDEIYPQAVETGPNRGGWIEIRGGLASGDEIAVNEVFLLKSLILKASMGEGHGH